MDNESLTFNQAGFVKTLLNNGVLEAVNGHRLEVKNGFVMWICGDGDQSFQLFKMGGRICCMQRSDPRLHIIANYGGPTRGDTRHPYSKKFPHLAAALLFEVAAACILKRMSTVVLIPHAPCDLEARLGRTLNDSLLSVVRTKYILKTSIGDPRFLKWAISLLELKQPLTAEDVAFAKELSTSIKVAIFPTLDLGGKLGQQFLFLSCAAWRSYVGEERFQDVHLTFADTEAGVS